MIPSRSDLTTILEECLEQMEAGLTIDEIVKAYDGAGTEKAEELRAMLEIAQAARPEKGSLRPPASTQRNSRQVFLAQAQKLQEQPGAARLQSWLRFIRYLQNNLGSIAFAATAILLLFIALGSLKALPGDGLYPVKLAAEKAGISLANSTADHEVRVSGYDSRRAEEVAAMIQMKRVGPVSFGGYLSQAKDNRWDAAGIPLQLANTGQMQKKARSLSGAYVEIKGFLGQQGEVKVESLEPRLEPLEGKITSLTAAEWQVGGQKVRITADTQVKGTPRAGSQVSIQAAHLADTTQVLAISVEVLDPSTPAANQTASAAASPTPAAPLATNTPEPTATASPTLEAIPILKTPVPNNSGQPGSEPGNSNNPHSGDGTSQPENPDGSNHSSGGD